MPQRRKKHTSPLLVFVKLLLRCLIVAVPIFAGVCTYRHFAAPKETDKYETPHSQSEAVASDSETPSETAIVKGAADTTEDEPRDVDLYANKGIWIKIVKHEHKLYVMKDNNVIKEYGVAVGKNPGQKERAGDMRTPEGNFSVQQIQDASSWTHDFKDGKGVIKGAYGPQFIRLKTGWRGIGIHGTHDPNSIGTNVTEGCIRLDNKDLVELSRSYTKIGMTVIITK